MFPLYMVETFESRSNRLKIKATSGKFDIKARVPRQDHLVSLWQARLWDNLPKEHLDWLVRPFNYIAPHHPLSQYESSESQVVTTTPVARETTHEMETAAGSGGAGTVFVKPVIKDKCTNCGAPMSWEQIEWTGPDQYACPACGSTHRVDYIRM
jgi:DNA-directed RNA polymerase subunit RPC12/RpoP